MAMPQALIGKIKHLANSGPIRVLENVQTASFSSLRLQVATAQAAWTTSTVSIGRVGRGGRVK
jgi:hypothetical protein